MHCQQGRLGDFGAAQFQLCLGDDVILAIHNVRHVKRVCGSRHGQWRVSIMPSASSRGSVADPSAISMTGVTGDASDQPDHPSPGNNVTLAVSTSRERPVAGRCDRQQRHHRN